MTSQIDGVGHAIKNRTNRTLYAGNLAKVNANAMAPLKEGSRHMVGGRCCCIFDS